MRVLPDVAAIDRAFDYLVPAHLGDQVGVGTIVRVALHGRRVRGWVVDDEVEPPEGVDLRPLARVTGAGPPPEVVDLTAWAAWRWAGPRSAFLRAASPRRRVLGPGPVPQGPSQAGAPAPPGPRPTGHPARPTGGGLPAGADADEALVEEAFALGR
ncbi:MAG: hypothetical protein M3N31_05245, partial [Actinomycetota bacterium]|nr:hypothetical protein [Actinomycetota bacterium]